MNFNITKKDIDAMGKEGEALTTNTACIWNMSQQRNSMWRMGEYQTIIKLKYTSVSDKDSESDGDASEGIEHREVEVGNCPVCHRICRLDRYCTTGHTKAEPRLRWFFLDGDAWTYHPALIAYGLVCPIAGQENDPISYKSTSTQHLDEVEQGFVNYEINVALCVKAQRIGRIKFLLRDLYFTGGLSEQGLQEYQDLTTNEDLMKLFRNYY